MMRIKEKRQCFIENTGQEKYLLRLLCLPSDRTHAMPLLNY
jgi:hypothetical protein